MHVHPQFIMHVSDYALAQDAREESLHASRNRSNKRCKKVRRLKGNGGVTKHLSLWDPSNDKLAHGYKLQTVHKQQLVH